MPLSDEARDRLQDPDFWRRYLFANESTEGFEDLDRAPDDSPYWAAYQAAYDTAVAEGADCEQFEALVEAALAAVEAPRASPDLAVEFPVGSGYALAVEIFLKHREIYLSIRTPTQAGPQVIGYFDAQAHPRALRWAELDLIGRAVAVADPAIRHPGPVLALASAFVVLDADDDLDTITPLMDAAFGSPPPSATFWPRTRDWLHRVDGRRGGVAWQRDDAGNWLLTQDPEKRSAFPLHSLREDDHHDDFPFDGWHELLAAAEATLTSDELPAPTSLVEECWIQEVRIGVSQGSLIKAQFGRNPLNDSRSHRLSLYLPVEGRPSEFTRKFVLDLDRTLRDAHRGSADIGGAVGMPFTNIWVDVEVADDLEAGLGLIRDVLRRQAVESGAQATYDNEFIPLN